MGKRLIPTSGKEFRKILLSLGFEEKPGNGSSHAIFRHPVTGATVPVQIHDNKKIPIGTFKEMIKQAGMNEDLIREKRDYKLLETVTATSQNGTAENGIYSRVEKTNVPNTPVEAPKKKGGNNGGKNGRRK